MTAKVTRIDALTPEQQAQFQAWRDKWVAIGLRTGPTDWAAFEAAVRSCYVASGLPEPRVVIGAASPMACVQADTALARIFGAQVDAQVRARVDAQVDPWRAYGYLGGQFWVGGWWDSP